jgi:hypothetical protein
MQSPSSPPVVLAVVAPSLLVLPPVAPPLPLLVAELAPSVDALLVALDESEIVDPLVSSPSASALEVVSTPPDVASTPLVLPPPPPPELPDPPPQEAAIAADERHRVKTIDFLYIFPRWATGQRRTRSSRYGCRRGLVSITEFLPPGSRRPKLRF